LSNVLNQEKLIVSGDEDLHQLIDPMTYVWNNNLKKPILFSKEKLTSLVLDMKYENQIVNPEFVLFKKIMLGCNGDRVQPLLNRKGIGEKTLLKFWERNYSVNPYLSLSVKVLKKDVLFYFDFEREDFESVFKSNLKLVNLEPTIFPQEVQSGLVEVFSKIMDLEPKSKYEMSELLTGTKFFKEI
jgi:5'-3' exonuclease